MAEGGRVEWSAELAAANTEHESNLLAEQNERDRVGAAEDITTLAVEVAGGDAAFGKKVEELATRYAQIRRVRRDGSCFIRAYFYGMAEVAARDAGQAARIVDVISGNKKNLIDLYGEHLEDFHSVMLDLFTDIKEGRVTHATTPSLHMRFQDDLADYAAYYGRFAASLHIQTNAILFEPFLDLDVKTYCQTQIETVGCEFEQASIIALATYFNVPVCIEYMDLSVGDACTAHTFPEDGPPLVHLLYRPGHYDVLIPKDRNHRAMAAVERLWHGVRREARQWRLYIPGWCEVYAVYGTDLKPAPAPRAAAEEDASVDESEERDGDLVSVDDAPEEPGRWRGLVDRVNLCPMFVAAAAASFVVHAVGRGKTRRPLSQRFVADVLYLLNLPTYEYLYTSYLSYESPFAAATRWVAANSAVMFSACLARGFYATGAHLWAAAPEAKHEGDEGEGDMMSATADDTCTPTAPPVAVTHAAYQAHRRDFRQLLQAGDEHGCRFLAVEVPAGYQAVPPPPAGSVLPVLRLTKLVDCIPYGAHVVAVVLPLSRVAAATACGGVAVPPGPRYQNTLFVLVTDAEQCPWANSVVTLEGASLAGALRALLEERLRCDLLPWTQANPIKESWEGDDEDDVPAVVHCYSRRGSALTLRSDEEGLTPRQRL